MFDIFMLLVILVAIIAGMGFTIKILSLLFNGFEKFFTTKHFLANSPTIKHLIAISTLMGMLYLFILIEKDPTDPMSPFGLFLVCLIVLSPAWGIWLVWTLSGGPVKVQKRIEEEAARNTPEALHERKLRNQVEQQLKQEELSRLARAAYKLKQEQERKDQQRMSEIRKEILGNK